MILKLINDTHYSPSDLRRFLVVGIRAYVTAYQRTMPDCYTVQVKYRRRSNGTLGFGYYHRNRLILCPKRDSFEVERMAEVLMHEMRHNDGVKHADMPSNYLKHLNMIGESAWWRTLTVATAQPKAAKVVTDNDKVARLNLRKARWFSKMKRAETALRKINKSLKYYEKKAACTTKGSELVSAPGVGGVAG